MTQTLVVRVPIELSHYESYVNWLADFYDNVSDRCLTVKDPDTPLNLEDCVCVINDYIQWSLDSIMDDVTPLQSPNHIRLIHIAAIKGGVEYHKVESMKIIESGIIEVIYGH